jgi:hypothetical protein
LNLATQLYVEQVKYWPESGQHIMAQFDENSIVVYQAYRPAIAEYAVRHQQFGGEFSFTRMSWIKPNFLWMMYRCGWATKPGQEHVLAIRLRRSFFDEILSTAVASTFNSENYENREAWKLAVEQSDVRLQWDPDHDPFGAPLTRRAIQLGLRGEKLRRFATTELLGIEDITNFSKSQSQHLETDIRNLVVPYESCYTG